MTHQPEVAGGGSWEFHDGTGPHDGWLYRHDDGTLVTEDGTVLEEVVPDDDPDPPAEPTSSVEPVETPPPAETPPPVETATGREPESSSFQLPAAWSAQPEPDTAGEEVSTGSTDDQDEAHDRDQVSTGSTGDQDEATDQDEVSTGSTDDQDEAHDQDQVWTSSTAEDEASTGSTDADAPHAAPAYLRWEGRAALQYVAGLVFVVAAVAAVLLVLGYLAEPDPGRLVGALGVALLAGAGLWGLTLFSPSVVTLRDGVLTVERGDTTHTFALTDPETEVDLRGSTSSPSWRVRLVASSGDREVLRRTDVDPAELTDAVRRLRRDDAA